MNALILFLVFISLSAFAKEGGNGGYSVVCRDSENKITSAEFLDILEGHALYKLNFSSLATSDEQIENALLRLSSWGGISDLVRKKINEIKGKATFKSFVPETRDAVTEVTKIGCHLEQAVNYSDLGTIIMSPSIYSSLDQVNIAALYLHEAIYWIYRRNNSDIGSDELESRPSRKLTALLLADEMDEEAIAELINVHSLPGLRK